MDINRIFSFEDETALEAYNTLNGVDLVLENRIGIAESAGGNIQTNNTITLKDLLLINDGTIQPIMVNPLYTPQVQEVNIMNVKSNSLVVDTNITEIGESIIRNVKYK